MKRIGKIGIFAFGSPGTRALFALWQKGYEVRHYAFERENEEFQNEFEAKKDGRMFSATSEEELLGLVAIWEMRGEDWIDGSDEEWAKYHKLMDEAPIYDLEGNLYPDD